MKIDIVTRQTAFSFGVLVVAGVVMLAGCDPSKTEASEAETTEVAQQKPAASPEPAAAEKEMPALTIQRIDAIVAIAEALEKYKADHGNYPSSGSGWAAYKMSWGQSKGENWLPELVPQYMPIVPREPTKSEDPDGPQFLYASDGQYFKVIAHYTRDCEVAVKSPRVKQDPVRTKPDGSCWAYGLWSEGGQVQ